MRAVDASRAWKIMKGYNVLVLDSHVYFKSDIPEKKLKNAIKKYARIPDDETPLMLIDSTILGSGNDGAVLTERRIFSKWVKKSEIPYNSINSAELVDSCIFINKKKSFWIGPVDKPNQLTVCNLIREIIGMEPQKTVINGKELKNLRKKNESLKEENEYLKKRLVGLRKADYMPPEELAQLRAELHETEQRHDELETILEKQNQKIKTVQPELKAALKKSEEEKSLLLQEVKMLHQEIESLKEDLKQMQLQRQTVFDDLTPEERHIYAYVVRQKGTINIAQLTRVKRYTADDIFRIFDDLESKGLIGRIVGELDAGKRFTSKK